MSRGASSARCSASRSRSAAGWLALRHVSLHDVAQRAARGALLVPDRRPSSRSAPASRCASERWRAMFPRAERPGFAPTFWALMLGLFANNVLPARLGEVARMAALSRETGLRRTQVLTTIVVERVFDLAALAVIAAVTLPLVPSGSLRRNLTIATRRDLRRAGASCWPRIASSAPACARRAPDPAPIPVLGGERGERTVRSLARGPRVAARQARAGDRDGAGRSRAGSRSPSRTGSCCRCSTPARPGTRP